MTEKTTFSFLGLNATAQGNYAVKQMTSTLYAGIVALVLIMAFFSTEIKSKASVFTVTVSSIIAEKIGPKKSHPEKPNLVEKLRPAQLSFVMD